MIVLGLALRPRNDRFKNSFIPRGSLPTHPARSPKYGHVDVRAYIIIILVTDNQSRTRVTTATVMMYVLLQ